jgi:hypothetical protein
MSEIFKIFLTSGLTIIGGVLIYAFGQIVLKFFIEPIQEQKKLIGELSSAIVYHSLKCTASGVLNPIIKEEAKEKILILSKELLEKTQIIPFYYFFEKLKIVTPLININNVSIKLYNLADVINSGAYDSKKLWEVVKEIADGLDFNISILFK